MLDGLPRLRLSQRGYLVDKGYYSSPETLTAALRLYGGPTLDQFETTAAA